MALGLWLKNYLTSSWFWFVSTNISHSHLLPVISGVSQGSILGPLLFILYMNDLPNAFHWSRTLLFADDTKCFGHIKSPDDKQSLQNDLYNLAFWSATYHIFFNPSKNTHVSFNQKFLHHIYNIRGNSITQRIVIKILEL